MSTRTLPLILALCLAPLGACKKQADSSPPDGDKAGGDAGGGDSDAGGGGGGAGGGGDAGGGAEETLTVDSFEEAMQSRQGDVADCFAQAKQAKADLSGKLALDITIAGDGSVAGVKFDDTSTIKEASITGCVAEKAKGWKFAKTRDGKEMTLPYSLNLK